MYMSVCNHTRVNPQVRIGQEACISLSLYIYIYIYIYMYICVCVCARARVCARGGMSVHEYICICVSKYLKIGYMSPIHIFS